MTTAKKQKPVKPADPVNKARQLNLVPVEGTSLDRLYAEAALNPAISSATTALDFSKHMFPDLSLQDFVGVIKADIKEVNGGNLDKLEGVLVAQAETLNAIFNKMAKNACHAAGLSQVEVYMRMALKAQSQCRTTVEAIAEMKFPKSATFIRQANIANQQQVNNGSAGSETSTRALAREKLIDSPNELLSEVKHAALDTGRKAAAVGFNKELAALESVNRSKK